MNTKISIKRAIELIRSGEHVKVDVSPREETVGELFTNLEKESILLSLTSYGGKYGVEELTLEIISAEIVDGRFIKITDEDDEEYNVYIFSLVPITNLTAE